VAPRKHVEEKRKKLKNEKSVGYCESITDSIKQIPLTINQLRGDGDTKVRMNPDEILEDLANMNANIKVLPRHNLDNYTLSNRQPMKVCEEKLKDPNSNNSMIDLNNNDVEISTIEKESLDNLSDLHQSMSTLHTTEDESLEFDSFGEVNDSGNHRRQKYSRADLNKLKKSPLVIESAINLTKCNFMNKNFVNSATCSSLFDGRRRLFESSNERRNGGSRYEGNNSHNNHHNTGHITRSRQTPDRGPIKKSLGLDQEIRLNEAENAWKPTHLQTERMSREEEELIELLKNFRALLNKITAENFTKMIKEVKARKIFRINSMKKLEKVVELLFEKCIAEPSYAELYAKLCNEIASELVVSNFSMQTKKPPLQLTLVKRCQEEFDRLANDIIKFNEIKEK
jgi:hypothetical protein